MLNISVIPQRKYNLAPGVINKLYNTKDAKVASVTSMADKALTSLIALTLLVILSRQVSVLSLTGWQILIITLERQYSDLFLSSQLLMTNLKCSRLDRAVHRYSQEIS